MEEIKSKQNFKQFYLSHKFIIHLCLLVLFFLLTHFWIGFTYFAYATLLAICLIDSLENGFSYVLFCIPYLTINSKSTILYYACILAYIVKLNIVLFVKDKHKPNIWVICLFVALIIYMLIPFGPYNKNLFLKFCMILFMLMLINVFCQKNEVVRWNYNVRLVSISLIVACLMSLIRYVLPTYPEAFSYIHRYKALFDNCNTLAMVCEVLLGLLLSLLITNKKWQDLVLFGAVAILGMLTFSKAYYIIFALLIIIMFFSFIKSKPKTTIGVAVGGVLCVGLIYLVFPKAVDFFIGRFSEIFNNNVTFTAFMNKATTDRYTLWLDYLAYWVASPLRIIFGYGLGVRRVSYSSSHNTLIAMLFQLGIVGSLLLISTIVAIIKSKPKKENRKFNKAFIIPFVVLFLICMVEDTIFFIVNLA